MASINQTILIRTDLFQLPEDIGLLSAQVAHIHFQLVRETMLQNSLNYPIAGVTDTYDFKEWIQEPYLLVKRVPNAEALNFFKEEAERTGLTVRSWTDTVYVRLSKTQQKAFPNVLVGISIGPSDSDKIRTILGDLPLL